MGVIGRKTQQENYYCNNVDFFKTRVADFVSEQNPLQASYGSFPQISQDIVMDDTKMRHI